MKSSYLCCSANKVGLAPAPVGGMNMTYEILIIGGGATGWVLAREFDREYDVLLLDGDSRTIERVREDGIAAETVSPEESTKLARTMPSGAKTAIVASRADSTNLLAAQQARLRGKTERVIALVNEPQNTAAFDDADITPVCASSALATALAVEFTAEDREPPPETVARTPDLSSDERLVREDGDPN